MQKKQIDFVLERLEKNGQISRNECLRNYISRLGAIISKLKKKGYKFEAFYVEVDTPWGGVGRDYVYRLVR